MEKKIFGRDVRILIADDSIDLAPGPELVSCPVVVDKPLRLDAELPGVKRTHPTTARELRRAERRRPG